MSEELSVAVLQRRLSEFAAARSWQPFHTPKNLAAALSVEAGELLEIFQLTLARNPGRLRLRRPRERAGIAALLPVSSGSLDLRVRELQ